MVSARDFRNGEVVRFKTAEEQSIPMGDKYKTIAGHICIMTDITGDRHPNAGDEHDCVTVRSIATGEEVTCYVGRLEKYNAPDG